MRIIHLAQIKEILKSIDIIAAIEQGFIAYSKGQAVVPPVGELIFENPPGDVHIKYGYLIDDDYYVVKIASGFYQNCTLNLPTSHGLMLLFNKRTGEPVGLLLDEGYLTNVRTAAAGAIAAKYLAPQRIHKIGIIGTGIQARMQLCYLEKVTQCRKVIVCGRSIDKLSEFKTDMEKEGFQIQITQKIEDIATCCNLIVTTTPSITPILLSRHIKEGTHITAIGADTPEKQELDPTLFGMADRVVTDSMAQCLERGDVSHAIRHKIINKEDVIEIGSIISGLSQGRTDRNQITIADLTGLAVQDVQIAKTVYSQLKNDCKLLHTS